MARKSNRSKSASAREDSARRGGSSSASRRRRRYSSPRYVLNNRGDCVRDRSSSAAAAGKRSTKTSVKKSTKTTVKKSTKTSAKRSRKSAKMTGGGGYAPKFKVHPLENYFHLDVDYFSVLEYYAYLVVVLSLQVYGLYHAYYETIRYKQC